ncbi:hypothetical protein ACFY8W_25840 [Streptomyces sp. NPDC012637]|uniref:hypothetical protein n=1 Tax=Streptomyces sp. NPDC012637 TaxID=3364842 RepID=UPI0036E495B8
MSPIFDPVVPAGAYDDFLPGALRRARAQRHWTPADGPLPALCVSHGAPPLLDDSPWMRQLLDWAQSLPRPRAIVIASAHWEHAPLSLSASAAHTPLVYDFAGFHPRYRQVRYDTPDASALARRVGAMILGIKPSETRSTALFQLATNCPQPFLARTLGIDITVAVKWQRAAAGDWGAYAADVGRRLGQIDYPGSPITSCTTAKEGFDEE